MLVVASDSSETDALESVLRQLTWLLEIISRHKDLSIAGPSQQSRRHNGASLARVAILQLGQEERSESSGIPMADIMMVNSFQNPNPDES